MNITCKSDEIIDHECSPNLSLNVKTKTWRSYGEVVIIFRGYGEIVNFFCSQSEIMDIFLGRRDIIIISRLRETREHHPRSQRSIVTEIRLFWIPANPIRFWLQLVWTSGTLLYIRFWPSISQVGL